MPFLMVYNSILKIAGTTIPTTIESDIALALDTGDCHRSTIVPSFRVVSSGHINVNKKQTRRSDLHASRPRYCHFSLFHDLWLSRQTEKCYSFESSEKICWDSLVALLAGMQARWFCCFGYMI